MSDNEIIPVRDAIITILGDIVSHHGFSDAINRGIFMTLNENEIDYHSRFNDEEFKAYMDEKVSSSLPFLLFKVTEYLFEANNENFYDDFNDMKMQIEHNKQLEDFIESTLSPEYNDNGYLLSNAVSFMVRGDEGYACAMIDRLLTINMNKYTMKSMSRYYKLLKKEHDERL